MSNVETAVREIREVGYTIIPNLIVGARLRQAQADAEALLEPTPIEMPGLDGKVIGRMCKGLFRKSRAFDDLYTHPTVLAIVRGVLAPFGGGIQLSTVMIKDVQPRENIRHMHRDDGGYPIPRPRPPIVVNTLLALDPFTRETGGTLVVPGSHKWTGPVQQDCEHVAVEMDAGSILMFDGSLWHNNGANQTAGKTRRALNMYYSQSSLRQVEKTYLGLTADEFGQLPERWGHRLSGVRGVRTDLNAPTTLRGRDEPARTLFITSDDRTGALEIAGMVANERFSVSSGPHADNDTCCVVDIASRHLDPMEAQRQAAGAHERSARYRCHKIDSGLRGNWPFEVKGLLQLGHGVAVVPSFPDAGRRCVDGVVYVDDVPVLESPFGKDPLTAPLSNRPMEVLETTGCAEGDVVVWDAGDNAELAVAARRCHDEGRAMVGPSGAVAAYAATVFPELPPREVPVVPPVLVICGSLNAMSREQIARLGVPVLTLSADLQMPRVATMKSAITVVATPQPGGAISPGQAERVASAMAECAHGALRTGYGNGTLVVLGGDTAAAIVGDETLDVLGTVDTAVPIARFRGGYLVTKGGGIGRPDTLVRLLATVG